MKLSADLKHEAVACDFRIQEKKNELSKLESSLAASEADIATRQDTIAKLNSSIAKKEQ